MDSSSRPPVRVRITALLALVFTAVSWASAVGLLAPHSVFGDFLALKPDARDAFTRLGTAAVIGLLVLGALLVYAGVGLLRGQRAAYLVILVGVAVNLVGDVVRLAADVTAVNAVPVVIAPAILVFLRTRPFRDWAGSSRR